MRSQAQLSIEVVSISRLATDVIRRNVECIKAIVWCHSRIKVVKQLEFLSWHANIREFVRLSIEEVVCLVDQCCQGMLWLLVKLALGQVQDALWDVCVVIFDVS